MSGKISSWQSSYSIQEVLGEGGYGTVHLARQESLDRPVALKVMRNTGADRAERRARFLAEARITAGLRHPNVIEILDHGADEESLWIAYEYLPGGSLQDAVDAGPLPLIQVLEILHHLSSALAEIHRHGIIHRDVKPANVLRSEIGTWKLGDFGIARCSDPARLRTAEGTVLGSPLYMAPENIVGDPLTPASDFYSMGCVIFHLLTGRPPFTGDDPQSILSHHVISNPPRASTLRPGLPPEIDALVGALLEKDPVRRRIDTFQMERRPSGSRASSPARGTIFQRTRWGALVLLLALVPVMKITLDRSRSARLQANLARIQELHDRGDLAQAEHVARQALDQYPGEPFLRNRLGVILEASGRNEEARVRFDEAVRMDPANHDSWAHLGSIQRKLGLVEEATASLERAVQLDGSSFAWLELLGVRLERRQWPGAIAACRACIRIRPDSLFHRGTLADLLLEAKQIEGAERAHGEATRTSPGDGAAHADLSWTLEEKGRLRWAEDHHSVAIAAGDLSPEACHRMALVALRRGWRELARSLLERGLERHGSLPVPAVRLLIRLLEDAGLPAQKDQLLARYPEPELDQMDADLLVWRAEHVLAGGNVDEALGVLGGALVLDPSHERAHLLAALAHLRGWGSTSSFFTGHLQRGALARRSNSRSLLEAANALDPADPWALRLLELAFEADPRDSLVAGRLGDVFLRAGNVDAMTRTHERFLKASGGTPLAEVHARPSTLARLLEEPFSPR